MTLNIRGIGESHKVDWVRKLKFSQNVDFICLQESRVSDFNAIDVNSCWGSGYFECDHVNPTGGSGSILSIWDPLIFRKSHTVQSRNFIATSGVWNGFPGITTIVNVYGPQSIIEKRILWDKLVELKRNQVGIWIFCGDFNAVRSNSERFNSSFCHYTASDFNLFISEAGLHEFKLGGRNFTYMRNDGLKLSKLDRFLVCQNFIKIQPLSMSFALPREHSDHSPVLLKPSNTDYDPPPFRFLIPG
ncbi:uncharacterized protein LOC128127692 [Lactuca sativa]|uniref:uncharacterized protein LOC128127692 n=1 Tax=Lactuca sativa TaxID=4236 RepID=UPI0022B059FC|nr:uncharacterized protein LOC128127692 [Lactuca sativa]